MFKYQCFRPLIAEPNRLKNRLFLANVTMPVETLPENDRIRFTISPAARKEVLWRLLALNHERAASETAKEPPAKKSRGRKKAELTLDMLLK